MTTPIPMIVGLLQNRIFISSCSDFYFFLLSFLSLQVGPGEVDEELEHETMEECSKHGKVIK